MSPPPELVVAPEPAPGDSSDGSGSAMAPVVVTVLASAAVAKLVSPLAGLACVGAALLFFVVTRRPNEGRFVLHVEHGMLVVTRERRAEPVARVALDEVTDVTLDRRSHPAARGGMPSERVHIAIERAAGDPILVPDERVTSIEGEAWQAKVRVFLRAHGWTPKDERP